MSAISLSRYVSSYLASPSSLTPIAISRFSTPCPPHFSKRPSSSNILSSSTRSRSAWVFARSSSSEAAVTESEDEWLKRLPEKKMPLYAHSLPCVEAWLKQFGFRQSKDDRAVWFIERPDWHAQLSLDVTDLYIRYLKNGPGNLDKDIERRFSYALSREDIENAILGGP